MGLALGKQWEEEAHPRYVGGQFAPKEGSGGSEIAGEVFVAALRNFSTEDVGEIRRLHKENAKVIALRGALGRAGDPLEMEEGMPTKVRERSEAFGAWYEERDGKKVPMKEPSFAVSVEGNEDDIIRQAASLGKRFDQMAVLVAVYDPDAEGAIFHLDLDPEKMDDRVRGAVVQHFLDAGLGGATSLLDKPSFRLAAMSAADAEVIKKAAENLPAEYKPRLTAKPARVRFIGAGDYDGILGLKAAATNEVVAEVLIGGMRTSVMVGLG